MPVLHFMREGAWPRSVPALPPKLLLAWAGLEAEEKKPFLWGSPISSLLA